MDNTLLTRFEEFSNQTKNTINLFRKTPVQLSNINKVGRRFLCDGTVVKTSAINDLMNIFSIKGELIREIRDDEHQWTPLQRCLSNIKKDKTITAITKNEGNEKVITKFLKEEIKEEESLGLGYGFDLLQGYLKNCGENVNLHTMKFNEETLSLETSFRDLQNQVDVFGDGNDMWDTGFSFIYGLNKTVISPFLLRQICTNGMTATHNVSQRYFSNKGLRQKSFNRLIGKTLSEDLKHLTVSSCDKMRKNNASLREYFNARECCLGVSKNLADAYFNDEAIQEAYKPYKIRYKNSRWLSSANSNINSYEFFNRVTHCVSHQKALPQSTSMYLNNLASELFFKGPDLSFQAPNPFLH
jgi:hypothetical protein